MKVATLLSCGTRRLTPVRLGEENSVLRCDAGQSREAIDT